MAGTERGYQCPESVTYVWSVPGQGSSQSEHRARHQACRHSELMPRDMSLRKETEQVRRQGQAQVWGCGASLPLRLFPKEARARTLGEGPERRPWSHSGKPRGFLGRRPRASRNKSQELQDGGVAVKQQGGRSMGGAWRPSPNRASPMHRCSGSADPLSTPSPGPPAPRRRQGPRHLLRETCGPQPWQQQGEMLLWNFSWTWG